MSNYLGIALSYVLAPLMILIIFAAMGAEMP